MGVPEKHRRRIARDTMRMHCAGCRIMGGMDHAEAARLLGVPIPEGCNCGGERPEKPLGVTK